MIRTITAWTVLFIGLALSFAIFFGVIVAAAVFLGLGWAGAAFALQIAAIAAGLSALFAGEREAVEADHWTAPEGLVRVRGRG